MHWPALQMSPVVHLSPSSQALVSDFAAALQTPDSGSHTLLTQPASSAFEHVTTVLGLTLHLPAPVSQNIVPLHLSPSSCAAQSASVLQVHSG